MKKLIVLLSAALLLPLCGAAQNKPKIKSVDLTIKVPTPGTSLFDAREYQLTSAKTAFGDLAPSGDIRVMELDWIGDFREGRDGDMFFKDGFPYKCKLQFYISYEKYETDYVFRNNDYYIDGTRISVTANGAPAKVLTSPPVCINVEFPVFVGAGGKGSERAQAQSKPTDYELNKDSYRASMKAYSTAEADGACPDTNPIDVVTVTDSYAPRFLANPPFGKDFLGQKNLRVTKIIVDSANEKIYGEVAANINNTIQGPFNIREVWISDKVDAVKFMRGIFAPMQGDEDTKTHIYAPQCSYLFHAQRATLFIPASAVADVMAMFNRPTWSRHTLFSLKTYTGDVYAAQRAGAKAAKSFCTNHVYTDKVASADKVYRHGTCKHGTEYYYSCKYCGKCERNRQHIFRLPTGSHVYEMPLADEQAYIGVNAAGQHVWWYSCIWCGHSEGYDQKHINQAEWRASGNQATYEQFRQAMADMTKQREEEALLTTTAQPGMFILQKKSDAKMHTAFQSVVNFALNDNLLDEAVLGNDYTLPLNYRHLRSLVVRFVKELTGKDATDSVIGLDKALGGKKPADNAAVTRQELAAVMYRTLRYIEECGIYSYTEFTSRLGKYSDRSRIAPWANEAMAFMEALGLMRGNADGTILPEKACTIEEAIELAQRCTHAHQLGWYQARSWGESTRSYFGNVCIAPGAGYSTNQTFAPGERVWVTGPRLGGVSKFLPITEPYTGQTMYVDAEWFRPVRKAVYTSKRTITGPIIFCDYFDGVATH